MAGQRVFHDVMSITKAALGLVYASEKIDTAQRLCPAWEASGLTLEDALHHRAGMHDDDGRHGAQFDYWKFRERVKGDATTYAREILSRRVGKKGEFGYSNLAWQLLAGRFLEVAGITPEEALEKLIGHDGWTWETDGIGTHLGPHGLEMTPDAARRLGEAAKQQFTPQDFQVQTPDWFWSRENIPQTRFVHNGWFAYKEPRFVMYAAGFMLQYVVVTPMAVLVQLRGDDPEINADSLEPDEISFLSETVILRPMHVR